MYGKNSVLRKAHEWGIYIHIIDLDKLPSLLRLCTVGEIYRVAANGAHSCLLTNIYRSYFFLKNWKINSTDIGLSCNMLSCDLWTWYLHTKFPV